MCIRVNKCQKKKKKFGSLDDVLHLCPMKQKEMTLRDKILLLNLKPRNAPEGIKSATFGKWLRAVQKREEIGPIATSFLTLLCDGMLNQESGPLIERAIPAQDTIILAQVEIGGLLSRVAIPHGPVNCMPGVFTMKDGKRVFNLDGTFWTGGSDGVVEINGALYEYPADKGFGNFKKRK